jgi:hypothetical protein
MKTDLLKTYWKSTYKDTVAAFALCAVLSYFDGSAAPFIFFLVSFGRDYYHYDAKLAYSNKLKRKGLTEEDIRNISFVKKWEEARAKGIWLYCITDGGIILGAYLWIVISMLLISTAVVTIKDLAADPGNMFAFIGYTYMVGAVIGVIVNRIRWPYNQRRFINLTDPFNTKFHQALLWDQ